jgi:hypothetical protein
MRTHLSRKNTCDPILRDINLDEYSKDILGRRKFIETVENPESLPNHSKSLPFHSISCDYCNKSYKYNYNLTKHLKTCKVKKTLDESEIRALTEQLDACKTEIKILKSEIE